MRKITLTSFVAFIGLSVVLLFSMNKPFQEEYKILQDKTDQETRRSDGSPGNYTGSPGDDGFDCTDCHGGTANFNLVPSIITNIPQTGYVFGTTYNIQVTATSDGTENGRGFELTAERADGTTVGIYDLNGATGNPQIITSGGSVTHNVDSFNSWSFNWTAPTINEGTITFYAAVVAGNGAQGNNGDEVALTNESFAANTLGVGEFDNLEFRFSPNPADDIIRFELGQNPGPYTAEIFDLNGKRIFKQLIQDGQNELKISSLPGGLYFLRLANENSSGTSKLIKR